MGLLKYLLTFGAPRTPVPPLPPERPKWMADRWDNSVAPENGYEVWFAAYRVATPAEALALQAAINAVFVEHQGNKESHALTEIKRCIPRAPNF